MNSLQTAKCSNCKFGGMIPQNLTQRVCRGAPPQIVLVPAGPGQVQMQYHWPLVEATNDACALHKFRGPVIDITTGKVIDSEGGNA